MEIDEAQKLIVTFRVEPGCLGPSGSDYVESFCYFAQERFSGIDANVVRWIFEPRLDKSLAENAYGVGSKTLSSSQAEKYISALGLQMTELEDHLHTTLADLIDEFMRAL